MDIVKLEKVRKILKGFHDELLKGERRGQRSVRLSKSWRVIYREKSDRIINLIIVEEVHKHRY